MGYSKSDDDRSESEMRLDPQDTGYSKVVRLFGDFLVSMGLLNRRDLEKALKEWRRGGGQLGDILVKHKMVSDKDLRSALAEYLATEYVYLDSREIDMNIARLVPETLAKRFNLVAIDEKDNKVLVAMADPLDIVAVDTIAMQTGREIQPVLSSLREIRQTIEKVYHGSDIDR